jgi:hypothetical protein
MEGQREYVELMQETAMTLWGREEAEKIRSHIETTAKAVYRNAEAMLPASLEPATRLRHREKP